MYREEVYTRPITLPRIIIFPLILLAFSPPPVISVGGGDKRSFVFWKLIRKHRDVFAYYLIPVNSKPCRCLAKYASETKTDCSNISMSLGNLYANTEHVMTVINV